VNVSLYVWQRGTAALMAPMIAVHLAVIFYAAHHGITAADILARTRGSVGWAAFYGLFVIAAAIHGAIGLGNVLTEWTPLGRRNASTAAAVLWIALLTLGMRAVVAVTLP
jgi:fumarate reductase subunit C